MNDELQKALLKKAGALLARRAYSRGELRTKLAKLAEYPQVESALDRLEQLRLLNDADYAYNFAFQRIRSEGWGPARVRNSLFQRHVPQAAIESALERIRSEFGDTSALIEYIARHCRKKGPPANPKDFQKLIIHLIRRGFGKEDITSALSHVMPDALRRRFDTGE
jgi:regulatory protein